MEGESNIDFWARRILVINQDSLGSRVALLMLALPQMGVQDVSYTETASGDFTVRLVSSEDPPDGQPQGIPTPEINAQVSGILNDGSRAHIGKSFDVVNPVAVEYGIFVNVHVLNRPDVGIFEDEISLLIQEFVRRNRLLGEEIEWSNLGAILSTLTKRSASGRIESGIDFLEGGFYSGANIQNAPGSKLLPKQANSSFYTCSDTVNVITQQSDATANEINLILDFS